MGTSLSGEKQYCYGSFFEDEIPNSTRIIRSTQRLPGILYDERGLAKDMLNRKETLQQGFITECQRRQDQQILGTLVDDRYQWITYGQVYQKLVEFGSGVISLDLLQQEEDLNMQFNLIGMFAQNCKEWTISDFAGLLYGFQLAPFYSMIDQQGLTYLIQLTQIKAIIIHSVFLPKLFAAIENQDRLNLKAVILIDSMPNDEIQQQCEEKGLQVYGFEQVCEIGRQNPQEVPQIDDEGPYGLVFTSGTTGNPKAVILTKKMILSCLASEQLFNETDVHFSYLPQAHIMERVVQFYQFKNGIRIAFFGGNIMNLMKEINIAKPSVFLAVPRILIRIYDALKQKFNSLPPDQKELLDTIIKTKRQRLKLGYNTHPVYDPMFFYEAKKMLGGRVKFIAVGSALIKPEIKEFLKIVLGVKMIEGYGQSETAAGGCGINQCDLNTQTVGGVNPRLEMRIEDVLEMEYFTSYIDENGVNYPRGEILFRGNSITPGYFKNPQETAKLFDQDGWLRTGDIVELQPDLTIKVIDRKSNIFKLSQGEYIAPEKIQNYYQQCPIISQCFVYGDISRDHLVGIIVPDQQYFGGYANSLGIEGEFIELCKNEFLKEKLISILADIVHQNNLSRLELVRKIHLTPEPFSVENGILTPTMKLVRKKAADFYKDIIEQLYS